MAELKTKVHDGDVAEFIKSFANSDEKISDSFELLKIMEDVTGSKPKMWGQSIIGFGKYHYKSDRSKQEGDWPVIGFSPRKQAISLYVYSGLEEDLKIVNQLGKYTMGKGCIYIKKLADINIDVLKQLMQKTIQHLESKFHTER
ncbi:MAG TPA: DUF1801 domain-containing protein [Acholeplasma sp.]|jgi:hypothetical protein